MATATKKQTPTLPAKLAKVLGEIQTLQKNGTNSHFKYSFAEAGDVSDLVRPLLAKNNIAFAASIDNVEKTGKTTVLLMTFRFFDGDSDAVIECGWAGEAQDAQDKGISKCVTSATKYFLLKTFMISTSDEADADREGPVEFTTRLAAAAVKDLGSAVIAIGLADTKAQLDQIGVAIKGQLNEGEREKVRPAFTDKMKSILGKQ